MLKLPSSAETFLDRYWQKELLLMPKGLDRIRPSVSRNELGWLATLEDVESRLVFTERDGDWLRYSAETGPFDPDYLVDLPKRDWTLLVHDVEKHLPVMRRLFAHVPFIPDWRIDDLMVSFAAPGGGVGPHRDNYDVFLCQGIGIREWHVATDEVPDDPEASDDLALTAPFAGKAHTVREGDVVYLPPGVAHWGTASRACITYSIGMRAPQLSDLLTELPDTAETNPFYTDPDLGVAESKPGYISPRSAERAVRLAGGKADAQEIAEALGRSATQTKDWITPDKPTSEEIDAILRSPGRNLSLKVHGMARIAWDDRNVYVNGACRPRADADPGWLQQICEKRAVPRSPEPASASRDCLRWMLENGTFEIPETL